MNLGILCINTGTPDEPSIEAIGRYLEEFLMDPAIISAPLFVRKRIVGKIVKERPYKTLETYQQFWTEEGSPYRLMCQKQCSLLEKSLKEHFRGQVTVVSAMRYGNPSIIDGLRALRDKGCDTLILFPTYPQQVKVCAGTCIREAWRVFEQVKKENSSKQSEEWTPKVYEIPYFYDLPSYRQALAQSVRAVWTHRPGSKILLSFHSTLMKDIKNGDPYQEQIEKTRSNLAYDLGLSSEDVLVAYQSRFDSRKWLQPFTEKEVVRLAQEGVTDLCVVCPIFVATNTETTVDIKEKLRETYLSVAQEDARFVYVEELNSDPGLIEALKDAVVRVLV